MSLTGDEMSLLTSKTMSRDDEWQKNGERTVKIVMSRPKSKHRSGQEWLAMTANAERKRSIQAGYDVIQKEWLKNDAQ